MTDRLGHFIKEAQIVNELRNPRNKLIMVMGDADTGKTSLIECIAGLLSRQLVIGIVDLDMGQSHIGLPTTIAWGKVKGEFKGWTDINVEDYYFTGTLTPPGSLLPAVVGAKLITDKASSLCEKVVIDTTGLIAEPVGRILKQFKIELLSPHIILALELSKELEHILDGYKSQKPPDVYRLSVPGRVTSKSVSRRTRFREDKFISYFTSAHVVEVSLNDTGIRFTKEPIRLSTTDMKNRIVSFRDEGNRDLALGVIEGIELKRKKLLIRSPINNNLKFSTIVIGSVKI